MKCKECGGSLNSVYGQGLVLECAACAKFPADCQCDHESRLGYTPPRYAHCLRCQREYLGPVDTKEHDWRQTVL